MGYTTRFTGAIALSRKLTFAEAKELLEIHEMDPNKAKEITGVLSYLQWVPADTLEHIVWDMGEKFYDYIPLLKWVCRWLKDKGITADGKLFWDGEYNGDTGQLVVTNNNVLVEQDKAEFTPKPLTLRALGEMALEQITNCNETITPEPLP